MRISKFIPFSIAVILVLLYLIQIFIWIKNLFESGESFSYTITIYSPIQNAIFGLMITMFFIIIKKNIWKYVFLVLILISFTGLVEFSNYTLRIKFGSLSIELTALVLLIFHLATNPDILSKIIQKFEPNEESLRKKEELKKQHFEANVIRFEQNFNSKKKSELELMVNENKLRPEAIEAARRLLKN